MRRQTNLYDGIKTRQIVNLRWLWILAYQFVSWHAYSFSTIKIGGLRAGFFYYYLLKVTLGVSNRCSCYYGNLLAGKNFHNLFTIDCAFVLYHYESENVYRKVATIQQTASVESAKNWLRHTPRFFFLPKSARNTLSHFSRNWIHVQISTCNKGCWSKYASKTTLGTINAMVNLSNTQNSSSKFLSLRYLHFTVQLN